MPRHVAVGRAEGHQGEVEALNQEELLDVHGANLNMSIERVDIQQADRPSKKKDFLYGILSKGKIRKRTYTKYFISY